LVLETAEVIWGEDERRIASLGIRSRRITLTDLATSMQSASEVGRFVAIKLRASNASFSRCVNFLSVPHPSANLLLERFSI